jgi:hypothetical protein
MTTSNDNSSEPHKASPPKLVSVTLSSQPPRLLRRLAVLPDSDQKTWLVSAINFLIDHWDQIRLQQLKTQVLAYSASVSQLEEAHELDSSIVRDQRRQDGTRRPRRPNVDQWIEKKLTGEPNAKSPDLWRAAPEWITDDIGQRAFAARVTAARKKTRK